MPVLQKKSILLLRGDLASSYDGIISKNAEGDHNKGYHSFNCFGLYLYKFLKGASREDNRFMTNGWQKFLLDIEWRHSVSISKVIMTQQETYEWRWLILVDGRLLHLKQGIMNRIWNRIREVCKYFMICITLIVMCGSTQSSYCILLYIEPTFLVI